MLEVKVRVPAGADLSQAERLIEACCADEGLSVTMRTSLRMYGDNVHWHFKKGEERGTLEITLLRAERGISFYVHDNRRGPWTKKAIGALKPAIEKGLKPK